MKVSVKIILSLLIVTTLTATVCAKKKNKDPEMTFTETAHDFGTIDQNAKSVVYEFEFENTGGSPLVIYNATADCGCTRPEYPKSPVAPGKKGKIKVTFMPRGYRGGFEKNVKVKSNSSPKMKVLKISGIVNPNK